MQQAFLQGSSGRRRPPFLALFSDNSGSSATFDIGKIATFTISGLLAWFVVGGVMSTMPGILGALGTLAILGVCFVLVLKARNLI